MKKNSGKGSQSSNKSWLVHGYTSLISLIPKWINSQHSHKILFNKIGFVDLKDAKEKNLILEQYRILSEQVNKASENPESLNTFWITLNGAIIGAISYVKDMQIDNPSPKNLFIWVLVIFGFILSMLWFQAIEKIKKDIEIKNEMVMELEKFLPAKIFTASFQMKIEGQGKGSLSSTEKKHPPSFLSGLYYSGNYIFHLHKCSVVKN